MLELLTNSGVPSKSGMETRLSLTFVGLPHGGHSVSNLYTPPDIPASIFQKQKILSTTI